MNRIKIIIFISILFNNFISGQLDPGAKQISLSHSDIAFSNDVFSLFTNPSGLSKIPSSQFGIYYSPSPFGIKEMANAYLAFNQTTDLGSFAVGLLNYGFNLYKENKFFIGYGNNYNGKFYYGFSAYYESIAIKNYGNVNFFNISIGGSYSLSKELFLGFAINDILRNKEYSPNSASVRSGISYMVLKNSMVHFSIFKQLNFPVSVCSGIEYDIIKYFSLRFGVQNNPDKYSAGAGINYSIFKVDYAVNQHKDLGLTHQLGILINF